MLVDKLHCRPHGNSSRVINRIPIDTTTDCWKGNGTQLIFDCQCETVAVTGGQ